MSNVGRDPGGRRTVGLARVEVSRFTAHPSPEAAPDWVIVEEPLELRLRGETLAVTMRTPGHDHELAAGFLAGEGLITSPEDILGMRHCGGESAPNNVLDIIPRAGGPLDREALPLRQFVTSSACGLCGRDQIDDLERRLSPLVHTTPWPRDGIVRAIGGLREHQHNYQRTGGGHAAGVFGCEGSLGVVREDVGRHNAVDKVVGRLLLDARFGQGGQGLLVSGRVSYEIVQKAAMARLGLVAGVSAPTSLAVATAQRLGMTLIGFARDASFNVYSGSEFIEQP